MKNYCYVIVLLSFLLACTSPLSNSESVQKKPMGKHLFILSGQSNMARLKPEQSFTPKVEAEFGKENIVVVKQAVGGQPIRRWYKDWKAPKGMDIKAQPDLYDTLMTRVYRAIENEQIASVSFFWMQGERDAREELGEVYERSLFGLHQQLSKDLKRKDVNFVIGRLSDFDMVNAKYKHWTMVRGIQEKVAKSNPRFDWIDTDDLNTGLDNRGRQVSDDLHMSEEGYRIMGQRFAEKAIKLIHHHY